MTWTPVLGQYDVHADGRVRNRDTGRVLSTRLNNRGYVTVQLHVGGRNCVRLVHRLMATAHIPNPADAKCVDHIDRDVLNNALGNLRWATHAQNLANRRKDARGGMSRYRGVIARRLARGGTSWQAAITVDGVRTALGAFPTEEDAARAYDAAARAAYGDFVLANLPDADADAGS